MLTHLELIEPVAEGASRASRQSLETRTSSPRPTDLWAETCEVAYRATPTAIAVLPVSRLREMGARAEPFGERDPELVEVLESLASVAGTLVQEARELRFKLRREAEKEGES